MRLPKILFSAAILVFCSNLLCSVHLYLRQQSWLLIIIGSHYPTHSDLQQSTFDINRFAVLFDIFQVFCCCSYLVYDCSEFSIKVLRGQNDIITK